jgi:hypothetical protein
MKTKINIKIKLNQILRGEIGKKKEFKTKYIAIKSLMIKFVIINKLYDISKFIITSGKCFPSKIKEKHFLENQAKFLFDWKVFSVDQFF